jgi:hypothetical protein
LGTSASTFAGSTRARLAPGATLTARKGIGRAVEPREGRQQRRVHVEDPPAERLEDARPDQPQVAREDHDVRCHREQRLGQDLVVAPGHQDRLDPLLGRPVEPRARAVGEHQRDLAAQFAAPGRRGQRPQIRPGARDADCDAAAHAPLPTSM